MKRRTAACAVFVLATICAQAAESFFDAPLGISAFDNRLRAQLRGTFDLEGYWFTEPPPGLIDSEENPLLVPRLTAYLDAQLGAHFYAFGQLRVDRGFDPSDGDFEARMDEYAVRFTPSDKGWIHLQVGKFSTVVGNWVPRHASWENPFVTAPLAYENVTGVWDGQPPPSTNTLRRWGFVNRHEPSSVERAEKQYRLPVIWGPSYASGAAIAGKIGKLEYAVELKNQSLSSRPEYWDAFEAQWDNPTASSRIAYHAGPAWTFGISGSSGSYLSPEAAEDLPPGHSMGDYRETIFGADASFARHHWQLWAEAFVATFEIPGVADAEVFSYYVEAKYKFTPQFFSAVRWNEQIYGEIPDPRGGSSRWGRNIRRLDLAPTYRFTEYLHIKLQLSVQHEEATLDHWNEMLATQLTWRF